MTQSSLIFVNKVKDEYHQVDYCNDQINNRIYSCSCTSTINEKVFINSKGRISIMLNQLVFSIFAKYANCRRTLKSPCMFLVKVTYKIKQYSLHYSIGFELFCQSKLQGNQQEFPVSIITQSSFSIYSFVSFTQSCLLKQIAVVRDCYPLL